MTTRTTAWVDPSLKYTSKLLWLVSTNIFNRIFFIPTSPYWRLPQRHSCSEDWACRGRWTTAACWGHSAPPTSCAWCRWSHPGRTRSRGRRRRRRRSGGCALEVARSTGWWPGRSTRRCSGTPGRWSPRRCRFCLERGLLFGCLTHFWC